jgi:hypothetical protein
LNKISKTCQNEVPDHRIRNETGMKPPETASSAELQLGVIQETAANSSKLDFECPVRYFVSLSFPLSKPCETRTNDLVIIETPGKPAQTCRFSLGIRFYEFLAFCRKIRRLKLASTLSRSPEHPRMSRARSRWSRCDERSQSSPPDGIAALFSWQTRTR